VSPACDRPDITEASMLSLANEWHVGQVFLSILWFTLFFIFIWLLFIVFADIFRSHDLSGWVKALWVIGIVLFPYIGILIYLIVRGGSMHERAAVRARQADTELRQYVQQTVGSSGSPADELVKLADLKSRGVITDAEFEQLKAKAMAGTTT
jgi:hypothetical protein